MRVITAKDVPALVPYEEDLGFLISTEIQEKPRIVNGKSGEFVIEREVVETSRISTQEYIDSFKGEVGIENILKKFAMTSDSTILNQTKRVGLPVGADGKEPVQDYSTLPESYEQAQRVAAKASAAYDTLPEELKDGRSIMKFAETCSDQELTAYITKLVKARQEVNKDVK